MSIRTLEEVRLTDTLNLIVVEVTEPDASPSLSYEVHCDECGEFTIYDDRLTATEAGPEEHTCWQAREEEP